MATPIPLHQPTQHPSTLALAAIPSFHGLVHHMCAHHTLSHRPLLTFMGMHTHASAFCQLSSTLHLPNAYGPPPSTLHQFWWCWVMGWGSHGCVVGRSCSWRYSLLCAKIFFLFYLGLTCIMFCQLLSESFEFFELFLSFFFFLSFSFLTLAFYMYMCSFFFLVLASEGLAQRGRHCHDS